MPKQVREGIIQQRLAHSKVVYLPEENLLVDTGPTTEWNRLESFISSCGGVDRLFLSHTHGDHIGNVKQVRDTFDVDILCPVNEPLDDTDLNSSEISRVKDGDYLGKGLRMISVPGHTPGIAAILDENKKTLIATDVLDGSDRRGIPSGHLLPPPARYNWDTTKAELNLEVLLEYDFEVAVVTHGSNVTLDPKSKLDKYLNFPDYYRTGLLES